MASWLRCNKTRFGSAAAGYGAGRMANRIVLTPNPGSVAVARRWTTDQTNQLGFSDLAETAALLVSELVTNAVLHAETECELTVRAHRGGIRVEVIDGYSAHADRTEMTTWLARVREKSPRLGPIWLVHGEAPVQDEFNATLTAIGYSVACPEPHTRHAF